MLNFPRWFQPAFILKYIIAAGIGGGFIVWLLMGLF